MTATLRAAPCGRQLPTGRACRRQRARWCGAVPGRTCLGMPRTPTFTLRREHHRLTPCTVTQFASCLQLRPHQRHTCKQSRVLRTKSFAMSACSTSGRSSLLAATGSSQRYSPSFRPSRLAVPAQRSLARTGAEQPQHSRSRATVAQASPQSCIGVVGEGAPYSAVDFDQAVELWACLKVRFRRCSHVTSPTQAPSGVPACVLPRSRSPHRLA